jgi:hypothetical protein
MSPRDTVTPMAVNVTSAADSGSGVLPPERPVPSPAGGDFSGKSLVEEIAEQAFAILAGFGVSGVLAYMIQRDIAQPVVVGVLGVAVLAALVWLVLTAVAARRSRYE